MDAEFKSLWMMGALGLLIAAGTTGCPSEPEPAAESGDPCGTKCAHDKPKAAAEGHDDHGQEDHEGHDHGEHAGHDEGGHEGHDQAGHEGHAHVDTSQPIAELMKIRCEHGVAAVECEQCRYEVGAVRVDPQLVELKLVSISSASKQTLDVPIEMNATVGFNELRTVHVSPRVDGIVRSLKVDYGDEVKRGATLFTLDSQDLGEATGEYFEARGAATLAEQTLARQAELRAAGVTSEREYLEAQRSGEAAQIRMQTARDRLARMGLGGGEIDSLVAGGNASMGVLSVRSPQAGTVLELHATPGEQVEPGSLVALVGDLATVWVWADIYEEDLVAVTAAMNAGTVDAVFRPAALADHAFGGTVDMLGASVDPTTRTTRARVTVDNSEGLLRPGMFGTVALHLQSEKGVITVPEAALCRNEGDAFVFVRAEGDLFFRRDVVPGRAADGVVSIRRGLEAGQEVVADGSFLLKSDVLREKMGAGCAH